MSSVDSVILLCALSGLSAMRSIRSRAAAAPAWAHGIRTVVRAGVTWPGDPGVVDADHADLRPDPDPTLGQPPDQAERHLVVEGDDRRDVARDDEVGRTDARLERRPEGAEDREAEVASSTAHPRRRAGGRRRGTPAAGPRPGRRPHRGASACRCSTACATPSALDIRTAGAAGTGLSISTVGPAPTASASCGSSAGRTEYSSSPSDLLGQLADHRRLVGRLVTVVGAVQQEAGPTGLALHALHDRGVEGVGQVVDEQAERPGPAPRHRPGRRARRVPELVGRRLHAQPRRVRDDLRPGEDPRHGGDGDPGAPRDLVHRRDHVLTVSAYIAAGNRARRGAAATRTCVTARPHATAVDGPRPTPSRLPPVTSVAALSRRLDLLPPAGQDRTRSNDSSSELVPTSELDRKGTSR